MRWGPLLLLGGWWAAAGPAAAAPVRPVAAGVLAAQGEVLGGALVVGVAQHPEFERLTLRLPAGPDLVVEVSVAGPGRGGVCAAHGRVVQPRWELLGQAVEAEEQPAAVAAVCARLEARGAGFAGAEAGAGGGDGARVGRDGHTDATRPGPDGVPVAGGGAGAAPAAEAIGAAEAVARAAPWRPRPLHGAVLLVVLGALGMLGPGGAAAARRRAGDLGLVALAAAVRLGVPPWGPRLGPEAGAERLVDGWGVSEGSPFLGAGAAAVQGLAARLAGYAPEALFGLHAAASALTAGVVAALARAAGAGPWGGALAGLLWALAPMAVVLAPTESEHTLTALWAALAALGGLRAAGRPWPAALAPLALAVGASTLLVHTRPEAIPLGLLPVAALIAAGDRRRALGLGLLLALVVGARVAALPAPDPGGGPLPLARFLAPRVWLALLRPRLFAPAPPADVAHFNALLVAAWVPVLAPVLAAIGLRGGPRGPRLLLGGWALAALLPGLVKSHPVMDGLRLQVGALVPVAALAGLGAAALAGADAARAGRRAAGFALALAVLAAPGLLAARAVPAVTAEWRLLRAALPALPPGAVLRYTPRTAHAEKTGVLLAFLAPQATVLPLDGPPAAGDFVWVGLLCRSGWAPPGRPGPDPCAPLRSGDCALEPVHTAAVPLRVDIDLHRALAAVGAPDPVDLGLYRAGDCRAAPAAPAAPPPG